MIKTFNKRKSMKVYITPNIEIIPSKTTEALLLEGSVDVQGLTPGGDLVVGGDEPTSTNPSNKGLWDED